MAENKGQGRSWPNEGRGGHPGIARGKVSWHINWDQICTYLYSSFSPPELQHFADHLKGLAYPDMPNYELLENCLIVAMKRLGIGPNDPFGLFKDKSICISSFH